MLLTPTKEQSFAIESIRKFDKVKGYALAGTGKTTLLTMIASNMSQAKILYLAFNKSMAEEARRKMPRNVEVRTVHSLAYKYCGKDFDIGNLDYNKLASTMNVKIGLVFQFIKFFHKFTQSNIRLEDDDGMARMFLHENLKKKNIGAGISFVRNLFNLMLEKKVAASHDFYLKLYELNISKFRYDYNIVLLDEAQDSNEVTCSIFDQLPGKKIMVGDSHQKIYGFRGAINAMDEWEEDERFNLTESFRFNSPEGKPPFQVMQANIVLKYFLNSPIFIKTAPVEHKPKDQSFCVLCRRNATVIDMLDKIDGIKTIRHPDQFFQTIFDIFHRKYKIGQDVEKFYEYAQILESVSVESEDLSVVSACKLIKQYKFSYRKFKELYTKACMDFKNKSLNRFVGTAHSSKGLEFDYVMMADDYPDIGDIAKQVIKDNNIRVNKSKLSIGEIKTLFSKYLTGEEKEEINLLYMAFTRAKIQIKSNTVFSTDSFYDISS